MRFRIGIAALLVAPAAAGCASINLAEGARPATVSEDEMAAEAGAVISGLSESGLPHGECLRSDPGDQAGMLQLQSL